MELDLIEEGTTSSSSASLLSDCCLLSPPSSGVSKLSTKLFTRLQAVVKYHSGEARVPLESLNREKLLIVKEHQISDVKCYAILI